MRVRNAPRNRSGASAVEMAFVAPIIVTMLLGQIETARLGMAAQLLTTAAREGCRVAVIPGSTQTDVQNRVNSVLAGSGISVGTVNPTPSNWATVSGGTAVTVSFSVPYKNLSWLGTPFFLKTANVSASATLSSENP
jgi:Flp pilus assembly protein TadG